MSIKQAILHICRTGEKEQFYTLYIEGIVHYEKGHCAHYCNFKQNMAHGLDDAVIKAQAMKQKMTFFDEVKIEVHDSPRPIYAHYTSYCGIEMRMSKSRKMWYGNVSAEFWDMWKTDKVEIKAAGYWIKRTDDGNWLLFKRVLADEIKWVVD